MALGEDVVVRMGPGAPEILPRVPGAARWLEPPWGLSPGVTRRLRYIYADTYSNRKPGASIGLQFGTLGTFWWVMLPLWSLSLLRAAAPPGADPGHLLIVLPPHTAGRPGAAGTPARAGWRGSGHHQNSVRL